MELNENMELNTELIWVVVIIYGMYEGIRLWRGKSPYQIKKREKEKKGEVQEINPLGRFSVLLIFVCGALYILCVIFL